MHQSQSFKCPFCNKVMHRSSRFSHFDKCPNREKPDDALDRIVKDQVLELLDEIYSWFTTKHGRFAIMMAERDRNFDYS